MINTKVDIWHSGEDDEKQQCIYLDAYEPQPCLFQQWEKQQETQKPGIIFISSIPAPKHPTRSAPPTTFHPFGRLPRELQTQIWNDALPEPARILMKVFQKGPSARVYRSEPEVNRYALLEACACARQVALRHFSIRFTTPSSSTAYFHAEDSVEWQILVNHSLKGFCLGIGIYLDHLGLELARRGQDGGWSPESICEFGVVLVNGQQFRSYGDCMHWRC